jgi:hypothetical protein
MSSPDEMLIPPMEESMQEPVESVGGSSIRKPCIKGKRRNPTTKRCRKTCVKGTRRNPKTKRCRKTCIAGYTRSRKLKRCVKN